jgi:hypothetical protein
MSRWKLLAAAIFLILLLLYSENRRLQNKRQVESFLSPTDFIQQIQRASGALGIQQSYDSWIGWMYQRPYEYTTTVALNDIKSRLFQPSCKFRGDWMTNLPSGKIIPIAAPNTDMANMSYKQYFTSLAENNQQSLQLVEDIRQRFMEPSCKYLNPSDPKTYSKNMKSVF